MGKFILLGVAGLALFITYQNFDDIKQTGMDKALEKTIKSKLGDEVDTIVSGRTVVIRKENAEYVIVIGSNDDAGKEKIDARLPVYPGSELVSHIHGVRDETISFYTIGSIEQIEEYFHNALSANDFSQKNIVRGGGQFNAVWIDPASSESISIFAYSEEERARITLIVSPGGWNSAPE